MYVYTVQHANVTRLETRGITLPRVGGEFSFHVEISPLVDLEQPQHTSKNAKGVESASSIDKVGVALRLRHFAHA